MEFLYHPNTPTISFCLRYSELTNAFDYALALAIDFQIYRSIAIDKRDQWTGVEGQHGGEVIEQSVIFTGK